MSDESTVEDEVEDVEEEIEDEPSVASKIEAASLSLSRDVAGERSVNPQLLEGLPEPEAVEDDET